MSIAIGAENYDKQVYRDYRLARLTKYKLQAGNYVVIAMAIGKCKKLHIIYRHCMHERG